MGSYHRFYDFRIDGDVAGYFELAVSPEEIYQCASFTTGDTIEVNEYMLRIEDAELVAFSTGEQPGWTSLGRYSDDAYPLSAFPYLIDRLEDERTYDPIIESTGAVVARRTLRREGETVLEYQDGRVMRSFTLAEGIPIEIDWGGATSSIRESQEDALRTSPVGYHR